jgi:hypothetical protein
VNEVLHNQALQGKVGVVWRDVGSNKVAVAAGDVVSAEAVLGPKFGTAVRVDPGSPPVRRPALYSRYNAEGPLQAGDYLASANSGCTAGFGAWDKLDAKLPSGESLFVPLQLSAGHCFAKGVNVVRGYPKESALGKVTRNNYVEDSGGIYLDAATIKGSWAEISRSIFINPSVERRVDGYETPVPGQWVCLSGVTTNKRVCGPVLDEPKETLSLSDDGQSVLRSIEIPIGARVSRGDSGGPAWIMGTGKAAGLITGAGGNAYGYPSCQPLPQENYVCPISHITTIQQVVSGAAALYNGEKLSKEGLSFPPPLYIDGVTVGK